MRARVLDVVRVIALFAGVAAHNVASLRVLEKCGFVVVDERPDPSGDGVAEVVLRLDA